MYKTIWHAGDIITTEKWNNIQNNLSPFMAAQYVSYDSENNWYEITLAELQSLEQKNVIVYSVHQYEDEVSIKYLHSYEGWASEPNNGYIHYSYDELA